MRSPDYRGTCQLCGGASRATWSGSHASLDICHTCAVQALPALIGDAIDLPPGDPWSRVTHTETEILAGYRRAMMARLCRERGQREGSQ